MPKIYDAPPIDATAHVRPDGKRRRNPPPPPPPAPPRKKSSVAGKVLRFLAVAAAGGVVSHFAVKKVKSMFGKSEEDADKPQGALPAAGMGPYPQIMPMPMPYFAQVPAPQYPAPPPMPTPPTPARNGAMFHDDDEGEDDAPTAMPERKRRNGPPDPDEVYAQTMSRLLVKKMRRKAHEDFADWEMEDRLEDFDA